MRIIKPDYEESTPPWRSIEITDEEWDEIFEEFDYGRILFDQEDRPILRGSEYLKQLISLKEAK